MLYCYWPLVVSPESSNLEFGFNPEMDWILLKWRVVGEAGKVIKIDTKEFQHFPIWKFYLIGVYITEATRVNILSMFPS